MVSFAVLAVGVVALALVADWFVSVAARLADHLGLSAVIIGVVVMGFGTSLPEMVVSAFASARGAGGIAVGNVVGSNVVNVTAVLGIAALIAPLVVRGSVVRREAPLALATVAAFAVAIPASTGGRGLAALVLVVIGGASLAVLFQGARTEADDPFGEEVAAEVHAAEARVGDESTLRLGVLTVVGLAALVAASQVLLVGAEGVADLIGLSPTATGVLLLAVGTSLPELAATVAAARAGEGDLIVGNLWGSNLFNATFVGAAALAAGPLPATPAWVLAAPVVVGVVALATMVTGACVTRWEGTGLVVLGVGCAIALSV
jgi:cation:H+ antiporter